MMVRRKMGRFGLKIGDPVGVGEPTATGWAHGFNAKVTGFRGRLIQVKDVDGDGWEVEERQVRKIRGNPWVNKREPNVHKRRSYDYIPTKTRRKISYPLYAVVYVYHGVFDHVKVYRKHDDAKKEWERLKNTVYNEDYDSLHLLELGASDLRHVKSTNKGSKWFMVIFIFGGVEVTHIVPFMTKKSAQGYLNTLMPKQRPDYDDLRMVQVTLQ